MSSDGSVFLRKARPGDADALGLLLYEAGGPISDEIFGFGDRVDAFGYLRRLAARRGGLFSWDITTVAEADGQVVGMCSDVPGRQVRGRAGATLWSFLRVYGPTGSIRLAPRLMALRSASPPVPEEDHQIINLAVMPVWRGRGIGTLMIERAHEAATIDGSSRCSLSVLIENEDAQRLYRRMGYRGVESRSSERLRRMTGVSGLMCMTRELE